MNYLNLLRGYIKILEIIKESTGLDISIYDGQTVLETNTLKILIDPEFSFLTININNSEYLINPSQEAFKNNKEIEIKEIISVLKNKIRK